MRIEWLRWYYKFTVNMEVIIYLFTLIIVIKLCL